MTRSLNVACIGWRFMGKAHSHAFREVAHFFPDVAPPVLQVLVGRDAEGVAAAARQYGWAEHATDWRQVVNRPDIDLVDISTANDTHCEIALAAARAGKHILCEKPLARNLAEARQMLAAVKQAGVVAMVVQNYRFAPAVQLAKQLIAAGRLGRIYHFRGAYLQDWIIDPRFQRVWRLNKAVSGSGVLGDLGAHIIDLARFLVGEIAHVTGDMRTFIEERPGGRVDVDDAVAWVARFHGGAMGVFEATRFAGGNRNGNHFEINGEKGSVRWNLEDLNWLEVYFHDDPAGQQGWRKVSATERVHPYAGQWWPPGHILGWQHTFVHQVYELLKGIERGESPSPSFEDGVRTQQVLEAVEQASAARAWVAVDSR